MAECVYADDAYLIALFPAVVVSSPGTWVVTIGVVAAGDYTITIGGVPYVYTADGTETAEKIRDALLTMVSMSLVVGSMPVGLDAIALIQAQAEALTVTVSGPTDPPPDPPQISIQQTAGGDNAAFRALWLELAKCGVPDCCWFRCSSDYTLYHAALAAHMILVSQSMGPNGFGASSFKRMRLGPAELENGTTQYATGTDSDLGRTEPGKIVLMLRRRHLAPFMCA